MDCKYNYNVKIEQLRRDYGSETRRSADPCSKDYIKWLEKRVVFLQHIGHESNKLQGKQIAIMTSILSRSVKAHLKANPELVNEIETALK